VIRCLIRTTIRKVVLSYVFATWCGCTGAGQEALYQTCCTCVYQFRENDMVELDVSNHVCTSAIQAWHS